MSFSRALAVLLCLSCIVPGLLRGEDETQAWTTYMNRATYLMDLGRFVEARSMYQEICAQFPGTVAVDQAVVGIARTHLAEQDYQTGITYLEDVLTKSSDLESKDEAQTLYCNLERAFRNARTRATRNYNAIKGEYEDISWWNIFKIFTKLRLRREMKDAEKELQELSDLHNLFNPSLLLPTAYSEDPVEVVDETDEGAEDTTETGDEGTDEGTDSDETEGDATETDENAMDRDQAYALLEEDIARLIALIPDDKLDEVSDIVSVDGTDQTTDTDEDGASAPDTTAVESIIGSELTSDTTDEIASAPVTTETTDTSADAVAETTEVVDVIGVGDELVEVTDAIGVDPSEVTTGEEATVGTTEVASVDSTGATTDTTDAAPAAASTTVEVVAGPQTVGEARQAYILAYQNYIRAHQEGDAATISSAMGTYRAALQTFNDMQNANVTGTAGSGGTADAPGAPVSTTAPQATSTTVIGSTLSSNAVVTTDRAGRMQVGDRNVPQATARRSLMQR